MNDVSPHRARLTPDEIVEQARAAVAEGRIVPHERMVEWFTSLEQGATELPAPPKTEAEIDHAAPRRSIG